MSISMSPHDLPAIRTDTELDHALYDELASLVRGSVFKPSDTQYVLGIRRGIICSYKDGIRFASF